MQVLVWSCFWLLAAIGCGSAVTKDNYEQIKPGMTQSQVETILGTGEEQASSSISVPGQSISMPGGGSVSVSGVSSSAKVMVWQDGSRIISVTFSDGKVVSKAQMNL